MLDIFLVLKDNINTLQGMNIYKDKEKESVVGVLCVNGMLYDYKNNIVIYDYNKKVFSKMAVNITSVFPKKSIKCIHKKYLRSLVSEMLLKNNNQLYYEDILDIVRELEELYYNDNKE